MIHVTRFTFNPFEENTYILHDDTRAAVIIDPGCIDQEEENVMLAYIAEHDLHIEMILNTHAHLDHIFGNEWAKNNFPVPLAIHRDEMPLIERMPQLCLMYGIPPRSSPMPDQFLEEGDIVHFGDSSLKVLFTPGHSPASVSFYSEEDKFVIAGDVLFYESIGRTDLPGGSFDILEKSILTQLFTLDDRVKVYPGHGINTTIGFERKNNPFVGMNR